MKLYWSAETRDMDTGHYVPSRDRHPCIDRGYGPVQGSRKIQLRDAHPDYPGRRTLVVSTDDLWTDTPDGPRHAF